MISAGHLSASLPGFKHGFTQALFNLAYEGIILISGSGEILCANPTALQLFGYPSEALLPKVLTHLLVDEWGWKNSLVLNFLQKSQGVSLPITGKTSGGSIIKLQVKTQRLTEP